MSQTELQHLLQDAKELKDMGMEDEALLILDEIASSYPQCIECYLEQVDIILNRGKNSEAELFIAQEKVEKALQLDTQSIDANYYMGYLHSLRRQWEEAKNYLDKAFDINKQDPDVLRVLGWVLFNLGQHIQGITYLKQAIAKDGYYVEALEDLAECYATLEQFAVAEVVIEQGLRIDSNNERLNSLKFLIV